MRIIVNNSSITIQTTPAYHFKGDRCYYTFTTKVRSKLKVIMVIDGEEYTAYSLNGFIRMDVTDVVAKLNVGEANIIIDYIIAEGAKTTYIDDVYIANGKTLPHRTHASATHIQLPKSLSVPYPIQVFVLGSATITNPEYHASPNEIGVDTIGSLGKDSYTIKIASTKDYLIGTSGNVLKTQYHNIQVREECVPANGLVLQYNDIDGCTRFAIGKIIDESTSIESLEYTYNDSEINSMVQRKVVGGNQSLKVAFVGVPLGQYIEDMLMSDELDVMDANFQIAFPCAIVSSQKVVHGATMDFVVTIKVIEL